MGFCQNSRMFSSGCEGMWLDPFSCRSGCEIGVSLIDTSYSGCSFSISFFAFSAASEVGNGMGVSGYFDEITKYTVLILLLVC